MKNSDLWDTVKTLFYAALIALFVRTVFVEPFSIPSGSMIPSLLVGDYLREWYNGNQADEEVK